MFRSTVRHERTHEVLGFIYDANIGLCFTAETARGMDGYVSAVEELTKPDREPGFYPIDQIAKEVAA